MKQAPRRAAMDPTRRRLAGAGALGLVAMVALMAGCGGGNTEKESDAVIPTLQISSDVPGEATGTFTVRFTFSAAVTDFLVNRILITNGFLGSAALTKLSDTVYTLAVTPTANRQEVLTVQVLAGAFKDSTGTLTSTLAYTFGQRIDTVVVSNEPTLTITHNASGAVATGPVTFSFDFDLDVGTSFTADDIVLSVGTLTSFTRNSGQKCTATVTLPAGTSGLLIVEVKAGAFTGTVGGVSSQQDYSAGVLFAIPA